MARTNPPPMESCLEYDSPVSSPSLIPIGTHYKYESFSAFDDAWRNNPLVEVLDLGRLVGTRPEGRRKPPSGCLHVCGFVARSWTEVLWNVL